MTTPFDVPASKFIEKLAKYLKENVDAVNPPAWVSIAKTGAHVERQPQNPDWWYIRCASLLRKIYINGPMGVERLSAKYGGRKDFGVKPEHAVRGGRANIRKALQQLEAAGLVEAFKPRGRKITREGRKILQEIAEDVQKELAKIVHSAKSSKGG
ncbi:30S ribosomal protein S19e [Candidatus Bathyarchaeota archaeon]|nr:30S ribosomal protein S19e [Candidatus Bathyarchaeota archaeon]